MFSVPPMSLSSSRLLSKILGHTSDDDLALMEPPRAAGPTLVRVEGPGDVEGEIVDALLDALDEDVPESRRLRRRLRQAERRTSLLGMDAQGRPTVDGRRCCYTLAQDLDRKLFQVKPEDVFKCSGCGAIWRIDNLVREERKHGR